MTKYADNLKAKKLNTEEPYENLSEISQSELAVEIAKKKADLAKLKRKAVDMESEYPLNVRGIIDTRDAAQLAQKELDSLNELNTKLFS